MSVHHRPTVSERYHVRVRKRRVTLDPVRARLSKGESVNVHPRESENLGPRGAQARDTATLADCRPAAGKEGRRRDGGRVKAGPRRYLGCDLLRDIIWVIVFQPGPAKPGERGAARHARIPAREKQGRAPALCTFPCPRMCVPLRARVPRYSAPAALVISQATLRKTYAGNTLSSPLRSIVAAFRPSAGPFFSLPPAPPAPVNLPRLSTSSFRLFTRGSTIAARTLTLVSISARSESLFSFFSRARHRSPLRRR